MVSLFSGIGAPELALKRLGFEIDLLAFCEIDKYAVKSYCAIHDVDPGLNLGDITEIDIDSLPTDVDLITHGSPCQDFSVAGHNKGGDEGADTRSSLMWNTVEIVAHCKPRYILWENVKNVISKKHIHNYDKYLERLEALGYRNYSKVLNAKDFGVPQNRERIFVISIRNDIENDFEFPVGKDTGIRLKDILEPVVDEKYYVSNDKAQRLIENIQGKIDLSKSYIGTCHPKNIPSYATRDRVYSTEVPCPTICSTDYKDAKKILCIGNVNPSGKGMGGQVYMANDNTISPTITINKGEGSKIMVESKRLGGIFDEETKKHQAGSVWDVNGLSPTLDTMQGGWRQPCIATKKEDDSILEEYNEFTYF